MQTLLWVYLLTTIAYRLWRFFKRSPQEEWVPKEYWDHFQQCKESGKPLFDKGEELPSDNPTVLIIGAVRTTQNLLKLLDFWTDMLTFGWLRFNEIIPVGEALTLKLCFKNISQRAQAIDGKVTSFSIRYPGETAPSRNWRMEIPPLPKIGDTCFVDSKMFFCPEIPGTHELTIWGLNGLVFAGPYGVGDRKYRIPNPGAPWLFRFHVSSGYEYRVFIIAFLALAVAVLSLIVTLIRH